MYDILFQNVSVIDGTGKPAYTSDVAVLNGKIVTAPTSQVAKECINGSGLTLCPGFIDAHSHGDQVLGTDYGRLCKVSQGITTEIVGQCGTTPFPMPISPEKQAALQIKGPVIPDMAAFLQRVEKSELSCHLKSMVGHGSLRKTAMGFDNREPTAEEMAHMKAMLREAMEQGAAGMSSGLIYSPSCYAKQEELIELCKVVAEYDGIYSTHMRNEASDVVAAVKEAIQVAEVTGCRLDISHHKICGRQNWGLSEKTLELIHQAIRRGVRITMDVYPYTASMTTLSVCLPSSFFANGPEKMKTLLADNAIREELKQRMEQEDGRYKHCGFEKILVVIAPFTPEAVNKTVAEYAESLGCTPFDAYFDLVMINGEAAKAIYFSMEEEELQRIMADENSVVGTDGLVFSLDGATHPRGFASFPKAIRYFVREKKLFTMEQMIHKMTQLPAERLMVPNKGVIANGYDADLLLIKADEICDRADYRQGWLLSEGIVRVFVSGKTVYRNKQLTDETPGAFIPHPVRKNK